MFGLEVGTSVEVGIDSFPFIICVKDPEDSDLIKPP